MGPCDKCQWLLYVLVAVFALHCTFIGMLIGSYLDESLWKRHCEFIGKRLTTDNVVFECRPAKAESQS